MRNQYLSRESSQTGYVQRSSSSNIENQQIQFDLIKDLQPGWAENREDEQEDKPTIDLLIRVLAVLCILVFAGIVIVVIIKSSSSTATPTALSVSSANPTPAINLNIAQAFNKPGNGIIAIDPAFVAKYINLFNIKPANANGNSLGTIISEAFTWQLPDGNKTTATVQFFERGWLQQVQGSNNVTLGAISKAYLQLLTQNPKKQCKFPGDGQSLAQDLINQIQKLPSYTDNQEWLGKSVKAFTDGSGSNYLYYDYGLLMQDQAGKYSLALLGNAYAACSGWKLN